ncbi:hypothetical protein PBY51_004699 [Eleginops maclovinus]|uniref:Uncharacterized protein n=1 Tax=Eleginops maclovinus TaxID=56733 RepID=A0AAN7X4Q8_ELEMC|nr:hypothetical protein PBY51_004699 [Eleginops maclovinus]
MTKAGRLIWCAKQRGTKHRILQYGFPSFVSPPCEVTARVALTPPPGRYSTPQLSLINPETTPLLSPTPYLSVLTPPPPQPFPQTVLLSGAGVKVTGLIGHQ